MRNPAEMTNEVLIWNYHDAKETARLHDKGSASEIKYTRQANDCFDEIKSRKIQRML